MAYRKPTPYEDLAPGFSVAPDGNARVNLQEADKRRAKLVEYYKSEEKVPMYLSPMYAPHVGRTMRVMINGISIYFRVDGSTQLVPKTFADEITARRLAIDAMLTKQHRMANVPGNVENAPGELRLL
jgi:hypothetical protein